MLRLREKLPELYMVLPEGRDWRNVLSTEHRLTTSVMGVTGMGEEDFVYTLKGRFWTA